MPELPEVETVRRGLAPHLAGAAIAKVTLRRADMRFPFPPGLSGALEGRRVASLSRRSKYLLFHLDGGTVVILHLGMSGRILLTEPGQWPEIRRHDHVIMDFDSGRRLVFNDPRRFGFVLTTREEALAAHPLLRHLGPEPLSEDCRAENLADALSKRKTPIKTALLDQRVIAGIGNIYASEALFRAGIHPERPACSLSRQEAETLLGAIRAVLTRAIEAGGSTLRDYQRANGELGYFQFQFAVYDREGHPCPGCDCDLAATNGVRKIVQSGRSTYLCGKKQT